MCAPEWTAATRVRPVRELVDCSGEAFERRLCCLATLAGVAGMRPADSLGKGPTAVLNFAQWVIHGPPFRWPAPRQMRTFLTPCLRNCRRNVLPDHQFAAKRLHR